MSQRTLIFVFKNGSDIISGSFRDITDAEFEKRLSELGYVKPKWYEFWKPRVIVDILHY